MLPGIFIGSAVASGLPFRDRAPTAEPSIATALALAVLLLAAALALIWFARQRGWLDRWSVDARRGQVAKPGLRLEQALRVSRRTSVYVVRDGDRRYLLAETLGSVHLQPLPSDSSGELEHYD